MAAYEAGFRHFAEIDIDELHEKSTVLGDALPGIKWHYIGDLRGQDVSKLVSCPNLSVVETVDSIETARKLENFVKMRNEENEPLDILILEQLQDVKLKGLDTAKQDLRFMKTLELVKFIRDECPSLRFTGLMSRVIQPEEFKAMQ